LGFAPDGGRVVSTGEDGLAQVWQPTSGKLLTKFAGHKGPVLGAGWCGDNRIVTGGIDKRLCLWDAGKGRDPEWSASVNEKVYCLAVDAKGRFALAGLSDGTVQRLPLPRSPESAPTPTETDLP
jgi:WD40 repeat protein